MYVRNLGMGAVLMVPAAGVYGYMVRPGGMFYAGMFAGLFLMPLIPMVSATALGALITAVSSRMRHKNLVVVILTCGFTLAILLFPTVFTGTGDSLTLTDHMIQELLSMIRERLFGIYPPARLFSEGVVDGNIGSYLSFAVLSILPFILLFTVLNKIFVPVCTALNARTSKGDYRMQTLKRRGILPALYRKEMKGYFSSSIYVVNTLTGYLLMVGAAATLFAVDVERVEESMGIPGMVKKGIPFVLAFLCSFSSTTTSSVSMEGKKWWIVKSLPISARQLFDSKILVNLTMALPCYFLAEILLFLALDPSFIDGLWLILIPLSYILLMSVLGISFNCRFPVFQWETEAAVVKQGGALMATMLTGFASVLVPGILVFLTGEQGGSVVMAVTVSAALLTGACLYGKNNRIDLKKIE